MTLIQRRIGLLFFIFIGLMLLAGVRAFYLATFSGARLANAAVNQQQQKITIPARRGTIRDRNGVILAASEAASDISATPYLIKQPRAVAAKLAPLLERPEQDVYRDLNRRDTGYVPLARRLPAAHADRIAKLRIEGIDLTPTSLRVYPRKWSASQLIGFINNDNEGAAGLEYRFNSVLTGSAGIRTITRDGIGQDTRVRDLKPVRAGADISLTIDAGIQEQTEKVLRKVGAKYRPKGASAIVSDPRSGEILATATWPQVDSGDPGGAPPAALMNRAVGFTYEPGSTFKPFTVAGALEEGKVTPSTSFNLPPDLTVYDRTLHNNEARGWATMTTAQILAQSDNVGAAVIGMRLGSREFDRWTRRFGFGRQTGVTLPGEERGILLPLDKYSGTSMINLPLGQGLSVTPMQMMVAYGALANGGILRTPQIVSAIDGQPVKRQPGRRVIGAQTAEAVAKMLKGVLAVGGTASEVKIPGYELAGKTGTANKAGPDGEYSKSKYVASFMGFAPADKPRLLISVVVDEPAQGSIYGSAVAAPAFGEIAAFALPYLHVPSNNRR